jgi:hypothetical protein
MDNVLSRKRTVRRWWRAAASGATQRTDFAAVSAQHHKPSI